MSIPRPEPPTLLSSNVEWAHYVNSTNPGLLPDGAKGQIPKVVWIGCSDSRVPESVITNSLPGDIFVHRNIANQYRLDDPSAQAVVAYAVDHIPEVQHIIVVGHTGCGGIKAAVEAAKGNPDKNPIIANWIKPLIPLVKNNPNADLTQLAKLNVQDQVHNIATQITGKGVQVHGWLYTLETGLLSDLNISKSLSEESGFKDHP